MVPPVDRTRRPAPAGQGQEYRPGSKRGPSTVVPRTVRRWSRRIGPYPAGSGTVPRAMACPCRSRTALRTRLRALHGSAVPGPPPGGPARTPRRARDGARPGHAREAARRSRRATAFACTRTTSPIVAAQGDGFDALAGRLADAALAFARAHGYHLPGRPSVALVADPAIERGVDRGGRRRLVGAARPDAPAAPGRSGPAPGAGPGHAGRRRTADRRRPPASPMSASRRRRARPADQPVLPAVPAAAARRPGGIRGDGTQTLVFRRPAPAPTRAVLRVIGRDGAERTIEVDGTPLTLGRATDNGLVLADVRVSRHHARLQARRGTLVFTDLGSTNGSRRQRRAGGRVRAGHG